VALLLRELIFGDLEVVVLVELPEAAVEHLEVFLAEELPHIVDVLFCVDSHEGLLQRTLLHVQQFEASLVVVVLGPEDADNHGVRLALLELWRALQKQQPRVHQQQRVQERLHVFRLHHDAISTYYIKKSCFQTIEC